jgi:hypothetical protein
MFSQLSQGVVTLFGRHRHLGHMMASRPSHVLAPLLAVCTTAWVEQDDHLSDCYRTVSICKTTSVYEASLSKSKMNFLSKAYPYPHCAMSQAIVLVTLAFPAEARLKLSRLLWRRLFGFGCHSLSAKAWFYRSAVCRL